MGEGRREGGGSGTDGKGMEDRAMNKLLLLITHANMHTHTHTHQLELLVKFAAYVPELVMSEIEQLYFFNTNLAFRQYASKLATAIRIFSHIKVHHNFVSTSGDVSVLISASPPFPFLTLPPSLPLPSLPSSFPQPISPFPPFLPLPSLPLPSLHLPSLSPPFLPLH